MRSFELGEGEIPIIRGNQDGHYNIKIQSDVDIAKMALQVIMTVVPDKGYPRGRYLREVTEEQYKQFGERLYQVKTIEELKEEDGK